ncbi:cytochrome P450 [Xylaria longipes]|nr:cytochrome P450 [Xylaria longipes]
MALESITLIAGVVTLGWLVFQLRNAGRRPHGFPPGPPTLPIIGNLHQMPKVKVHVQLQKWADEYGPTYSLILGTQVMVVISSDTAVKDLLDKRSAIYSSRPQMYLTQSIASGGLRWTLMPYGESWRMIRRAAHTMLNINASQTYIPYQDLENKQMLVGLLEQPENFLDHVQRFTNSLVTQMIFGFRTHTSDHEYIKQVFENVHNAVQISHFAGILFDTFPWLRELPDFLLPIRKHARQHFENERKFLVNLWRKTKRSINAGETKPCFSDELNRVQEYEGFEDDLAAYTCGVLQEAGADTSSSSVLAFIQAMVLHPEVQKKGQEEVDRAFGDKLPTLRDAMSLPYIHACVKETLRWLPAVPLALPHCVIKDDEYMGYKIPKGATVTLNTWGIHMDPVRYPQPQAFDPTRFDGDVTSASESANLADGSKRDHFGFGAGRRICPGLHVAERTMLLSVARLLWGFNFTKAVDDLGHEVLPPWDDFADGLLATPQPFQAKITCRSPERAERIRKAWAECQQYLDKDFQWLVSPNEISS